MKPQKKQSPRSSRKKTPDAVTTAPEEGDPKLSGRSRGRAIAKDGKPLTERDEDTTDENWESGRHSAD
jgi:hypothetical protein